ncbi:dihydrofolate reductase family protein [Ravibacter arvi]|uniref:Dihydrofolate reductase family protein n=1 Tax=Ravibacter arvi TaxID=2051041 RepID=A0ABP8M3R2_9BACT
MRNVVYGINLTADGCCDHTKGNGTEDVHEYFTNLFKDADLVVYGRKTYELMVPYWPERAKSLSESVSENEFAKAFDAIDKVVFSTTLVAAGEKTTIFRGNLAEEMTKLKRLPGKKISVGGVNLPSQLIALGLVDEFHFVIHPTFAGEGRRLMDDTKFLKQPELKLVESKVLVSGAIALHYVKQ